MDNLVVDPAGRPPLDPASRTAVGRHHPGLRRVWALPLLSSGLSCRYSALAPGESSIFAMDFSFVLVPGSSLVSGTLQVFLNTFAPAAPTVDIQVDGLMVDGAIAHARLTGGAEGTDYQLRWIVTDTDGNVWPRTALLLCAQTS